MRNEYVFQIGLAERHTQLLQVFRIASQQRGLAPVEIGSQNKSIKAVVLYLPAEDTRKTLLESLGLLAIGDVGTRFMAQVKILDPERVIFAQLKFVRTFGVYIDAHVFEYG